MAEGASNILRNAVAFVLDNWTALQLVVQQEFGGADSRDKAKWLLDVIVQVLTDNQNIEYNDLEDYIGEIFYNEFNTIVEDESLVKISQKMCQFQTLWREGNVESILKEIQAIESVKLIHKKKDEEKEENSSEEMEQECVDTATSETQQVNGLCSCTCQVSNTNCIHCNSMEEDLGNLRITTNSEMTKAKNGIEDEEGWKVVRRSRRH